MSTPHSIPMATADQRLYDVLALLERGVTALLTGDGFAAYLRAMARFPTYSVRNVALIHAQRPDATHVAGYRTWQTLGRQVRRGERGIRILVPHRRPVAAEERQEEPEAEQRAVVSGFGVASVFDIAQTEGEPLPTPLAPRPLAGDSALAGWLWEQLAAFLVGDGVSLARYALDRGNGVYWPAYRRIVVNADLPGDHAVKTLAHECAHHVAVTRGLARRDGRRGDAEVIAEGAAFVVLAHVGLDTGGYSFPYVAGWAGERATLAHNLEAIHATAATIIAAIEAQAAEAVAA